MDLQGDAGATQRSRTAGPLITPPFETVWPDVERCLRALLYRRGLDAASADDVVQEVALRALAGRVTYTSARDLLRWAGPVACNLHVDLLRQRAKLMDGEVDPERPAAHDVAGEVADRIELQRAFRGIAALRPADREAIMEAVTCEPPQPRTRKEAVRLAVRRHRARSRLALVMEQLAAWVLGLGWLRRSRTAVAVAIVPVAALPLVVGGTLLPRAPAERSTAPRVAVPVTRPVPVRDATLDRSAPAAARPPAARAAGTAVRRPAAPPAKRKSTPIVAVEAPNGIGVRARKEERRPDDRVVCVQDLPLVAKLCV